MIQKVIKIEFQNREKENALSWEDYESRIIGDIETAHVSSYKVYMKNTMQLPEMNSVIEELCNAISSHYNCAVKSCRSEECFMAESNDMLLSAIYHIELK